MRGKKIAILSLVLMLIFFATRIVWASPKDVKQYSRDIAKAVQECLSQDELRFSFDEQRGIFKFTLGVRSGIRKLDCVIDVGENEYIVYIFPPISVDTHDKTTLAATAEFLCRASYGLKNGNFELDFRDGEIRYKSFVDCDGGDIPTEKVIQNSIYFPIFTVETYCPGLLDVMFGGVNAEEAIRKCEGRHLMRFLSMLGELIEPEE